MFPLLFCRKLNCVPKNPSINKSKNMTLQVQRLINNKKIAKGIFLSINKKASLTIEMACILPWIILIWVGFISLWQVIFIQGKIQQELEIIVDKVATSSYVVEEVGEEYEEIVNTVVGKFLIRTVSVIGIKEVLNSNISESMKRSGYIKGDLSFLHSNIDLEKGEIDIVVTYDIAFPLLPFDNITIPMVQRCYKKMWLGVDYKVNEDDIYVYITETGTVYHKTATCSHLNLSISSTLQSEVEHKRNEQGEKYYFCERCQKETNVENQQGGIVYITKTGNRYHNRIDCSALLRNVKKVLLSQVQERGGCKRCTN